jgi:hypothetical protein
MKFCYIDESGLGEEPYAVMVGIITDAYRMQVTKGEWQGLLEALTRLVGRRIPEIHTCAFYPGRGVWEGLSGELRSRVITTTFEWFKIRKHFVICTAVDKAAYTERCRSGQMPPGIDSIWKCLGLHISLGLQKVYQTQPKNKGNTLLIFDDTKTEGHNFADLVNDPPEWTDAYYGRCPGDRRLNQIIDVPYFVDSKHASLIQMADFAAFFLRRYVELKTGDSPRYTGETEKIGGWIGRLCQRHISMSSTYPRRGRNEAQEFFWSLAPDCIREMRPRP